jgi:hypothetical protein
MATALILLHKSAVLSLPKDIGSLHMYFASVKSIDADELVDKTEALMRVVLPELVSTSLQVPDDSPILYPPQPSHLSNTWLNTGRNLALGITSMGLVVASYYARSLFR